MREFNPIFNLLITQEPTQRPNAIEGKDIPNHEFPQTQETLQIPQIHFQGSKYYTNFPENDCQLIKT